MSEDKKELPKQATEAGSAKTTDEALEAAESHIDTDSAEVPDRAGMRAAEAHRQVRVAPRRSAKTGDDSAVFPQPDRDTLPEPVDYSTKPDGERQVSEQPDRYAVGDEAADYVVEPNQKNRRAPKTVKKHEEKDPSPLLPAQFEGGDDLPAQYSF